jgi:hypothetical protein
VKIETGGAFGDCGFFCCDYHKKIITKRKKRGYERHLLAAFSLIFKTRKNYPPAAAGAA